MQLSVSDALSAMTEPCQFFTALTRVPSRAHAENLMIFMSQSMAVYSGPSILRPPMGPRKCGLILHMVLK